MSTVADLWALQTTDLTIEMLRHRLDEIEQQLGETPELLAARQRVAASQAELDRWRDRQHTVETQMSDLSAHIRSAEKQLMSGRVRNPKELAGMEANVASLKRRRSALEDDILEAMIEIDRCQETLASAQAALQQVETAWQAEQASLAAEKKQKTEMLQSSAGQLKRRWAAISEEDRRLYRELRTRKAGRAISLIQRDVCQTCGMGLPTSIIQQVRAEQRVFCPTCGRLLHSER